MIKKKICLLIVLCSLAGLNAQEKTTAKNGATRWEKTIRTFEQWDRKNSFPSNAVLFVGSSSIRLWPTRECFEEFDVINRGFGGSQISDVNYYADRIVLFYKPKLIVFYAGDNDIAGGRSAKRVLDDYVKFVKMVREKLPETRIIFVSIKPSGSRWSFWNVMNEANKMIEEFSSKDDHLFYFDGAAALFDGDGRPDPQLFMKDQLHLNSKGYEVWTKLLRPVIKKTLNVK